MNLFRSYLRVLIIVAWMVFLLLMATMSAGASGLTPQQLPASLKANGSSVLLVENAGQWDVDARFQVWGGPGQTMWIGRNGAIWITLLEPRLQEEWQDATEWKRPDVAAQPTRGVNLRITFPNANPHPRIEPFAPADTVVSYFLGADESRWRPHVPVWRGVRFVDLYPGVDLILTGDHGLTWKLDCHGMCDQAWSQVQMRVEGADSLVLVGDPSRLDAILAHTAAGDVRLPLLQTPAAIPAASPRIQDAAILAPFRPAATSAPEAATDLGPGLIYSTFLGGSDWEGAEDKVVDDHGRAYITGYTRSSNFPTTPGAFDRSQNNRDDIFVAKLSGQGDHLFYATFVGGSSTDKGTGIAVDASGRAYVTGYTVSDDFPTSPGAYSRQKNGSYDAVVFKLSGLGDALFFSTYLGGAGTIEYGEDIGVDSWGQVYVLGSTKADDFPTTPGAFQTSYQGGWSDAFVTALSADGGRLVYSTYLGGNDGEIPGALTVDPSGVAYITGATESSDFPVNADDQTLGGEQDAFVTVLAANGRQSPFSTFFGGSSKEWGNDLALSDSGVLYVTGTTWSTDLPRSGGSLLRGDSDAFVAVFIPRQNGGLAWSMYVGGTGNDYGRAIALGPDGDIYLAGDTTSDDFPVTDNALLRSRMGENDGFLQRLSSAGTLRYGSYLGGSGEDWPDALAVNVDGDAYIAGQTSSADFPTTSGALDTTFNQGADVFVTRMDVIPPTLENVRASADDIYRTGCNLSPSVSVIRADAADAHLDKVTLFYKTPLDFFHWRQTDMTLESGHTYKASLSSFLAGSISYYVQAKDTSGQTATSSTSLVQVHNCTLIYLPMVHPGS